MSFHYDDVLLCSVSDEHHKTVHPDGVVDNLADFVDILLTHQPHPHK